ncbi:hypothetical protein [Streptomyces sp. NPDC058653]|uniref:hypothetical protein n=1 Tax=Streptomyces sp. NPDC058653 TaxID=3346576 RepID=UPI00364AE9F1
MADTEVDEQSDDGAAGAARANRQHARDERRAARLAKQIGAFARRHGGAAEGQLAHLGQAGTRIVLVAQDGDWGDLVAPSHDVALKAVEKSGITVHESFDGEFAANVRTGPYEWTRMAGIQLGGPANPTSP